MAGIDVEEEKSVATYISPGGDVKDSFQFEMNTEGRGYFASRTPQENEGNV